MSSFCSIVSRRMVYFWTYVHPSYCPSDLLARGLTAARWTAGRSARPPSLSQPRRSAQQVRCAVQRMGSRTDKHFLQRVLLYVNRQIIPYLNFSIQHLEKFIISTFFSVEMISFAVLTFWMLMLLKLEVCNSTIFLTFLLCVDWSHCDRT